jgi:hypothetical protein
MCAGWQACAIASGRASSLRRGEWVAAYGTYRTTTLRGTYLDALDPRLPILTDPPLNPRTPRLLLQVDNRLRNGGLLHTNAQVLLRREGGGQAAYLLRGLEGVNGVARLAIRGLQGRVSLTDTLGNPLPHNAEREGGTLLVRWNLSPDGQVLTIALTQVHLHAMSRATLWLWLTVIALRLAYAPLATQIDPLLRANPLHGDAILHDQMAWRLVSTGEYRLDKGLMTAPAYIYLMAGVYALAGHAPIAVRLLNALLGLLALWGLWRLTHRLAGERAANLALLLGALHPHMLMITGWLYTENLALPLTVWAVYGLLAWRTGWGYAASGALLGLLALTRANFLPFVAIAGAWLLWRERGWRPPAMLLTDRAADRRAVCRLYLRAVWRVRPYRARWLCAAVGEQRVRRRRVRPALSGTHAHHRRRDEDDARVAERDRPHRARPPSDAPCVAVDTGKPHAVAAVAGAQTCAYALGVWAAEPRQSRRRGGVAPRRWRLLAVPRAGGLWAVAAAHDRPRVRWLAVLFLGWTLLTILLYAGGSRPLLPAQPLLTLGAAAGIGAIRQRRGRHE